MVQLSKLKSLRR